MKPEVQSEQWYYISGGIITWPIQDDPTNMTEKFEVDQKIHTNELYPLNLTENILFWSYSPVHVRFFNGFFINIFSVMFVTSFYIYLVFIKISLELLAFAQQYSKNFDIIWTLLIDLAVSYFLDFFCQKQKIET